MVRNCDYHCFSLKTKCMENISFGFIRNRPSTPSMLMLVNVKKGTLRSLTLKEAKLKTNVIRGVFGTSRISAFKLFSAKIVNG